MLSISDSLLENGGDESDGFRSVEGETPSESLLGKRAGLNQGLSSRCVRGVTRGGDGPDEGGAYPALVGRFSWFEIKP